MHPHLIPQSKALNFIVAGKALFTLRSVRTTTRFTYKVSVPKGESKEDPKILFVGVLTGSDNESSYTYIGFIRKIDNIWSFSYGSKSRIKIDAPSVIAFNYVFGHLCNNTSMSGLEIWHEGKCGRCGRTLTDPDSIERGIGPECASIKTKYEHKFHHTTN